MTLSDDFPTKREFNCLEFVRLRALYLPNLSSEINENEEDKQNNDEDGGWGVNNNKAKRNFNFDVSMR